MKISNAQPHQVRDQQKQAIAQQTQATAAVQNFRRRLEQQYGFPVVLENLHSTAGAGGTVRSHWDQRTNVRCHSISLAPCEPWARPHAFAHELMHIGLECEAHAAGKRMTSGMSPQTQQRLLAMCDPSKRDDVQLIKKLSSYARNAPVDLVVEARVRRELPEVAPAQFVNLHNYEAKNASTVLTLKELDATPRLRTALESLVAVRSLAVDDLMSGQSSHFDRWRGTPAGNLAEQLFAEFKSRFERGLQPGEHYELMNHFAEIVGLPGLHSWTSKTAYEVMPAATVGIA